MKRFITVIIILITSCFISFAQTSTNVEDNSGVKELTEMATKFIHKTISVANCVVNESDWEVK